VYYISIGNRFITYTVLRFIHYRRHSPIKQQFGQITYYDLFTIEGIVRLNNNSDKLCYFLSLKSLWWFKPLNYSRGVVRFMCNSDKLAINISNQIAYTWFDIFISNF